MFLFQQLDKTEKKTIGHRCLLCEVWINKGRY